MSRNEDHSETIIQFQVGEVVPVRDKVVAVPWQVAALHQLLRRAGENPPKEEILQTSKETGLDVRWIRNWLSRHRKGRAKSGGEGSTTKRKKDTKPKSAPASTTASTLSAADHSGSGCAQQADLGGTISIHRLLQFHEDTGHREKRKRKQDAAVPSSAVELPATAPTIPYVQIAKPGTSFSLPLRPAAQAPPESSSSSSSSVYSLQVDSGIKTRSLAQSPSLGYIPLAFPMHLSQPPGANVSDHSTSHPTSAQPIDAGSTSASAIPDSRYSLGGEATQPMMYSQCFMPIVPKLPLESAQPDSVEGQPSSNMLYLSQLLLDASNVHVPPPATAAAGDSEYLSGLSPLSFVPSLQSHSTSVLGAVNMNLHGQSLWYPPPPVAFKARVTDLALLTKRIRTTYEQGNDVRSVEGSSIPDGEDLSTDASVSSVSVVSRGSSHLSVSRHDALGTSVAPTPEEDDSDVDEEELLTPTGESPSFIDGLTRSEGSTKTGGKGKQVFHEDGFLSEVA